MKIRLDKNKTKKLNEYLESLNEDITVDKSDITKAPFYDKYVEYNKSFNGKTGVYMTVGGYEAYVPEMNPWTGHLIWNPDWKDDWEDL